MGILIILIVLLGTGPIMAHGFAKRQKELTDDLLDFILQHKDDIAARMPVYYKDIMPVTMESRLIRYRYCYSYIIMTSTRSSAIFLEEYASEYEEAKTAKITCQLITAISGWWGIPWGIINSVQFLFTNGFKNGNFFATVGDMVNGAIEAERKRSMNETNN